MWDKMTLYNSDEFCIGDVINMEKYNVVNDVVFTFKGIIVEIHPYTITVVDLKKYNETVIDLQNHCIISKLGHFNHRIAHKYAVMAKQVEELENLLRNEAPIIQQEE